jgi:hypothetical protein
VFYVDDRQRSVASGYFAMSQLRPGVLLTDHGYRAQVQFDATVACPPSGG